MINNAGRIITSLLILFFLVGFYLLMFNPDLISEMIFYYGYIVLFLLAVGLLAYAKSSFNKAGAVLQKKIDDLEEKKVDDPNNVQASIDLAHAKIESYVERNQFHIRVMFWVIIFIILLGFMLLISGVFFYVQDPNNKASYLPTISGVVIEFIGATFFVINHQLHRRSKEYVSILQKIIFIGVQVQMINSIKDKKTKDEALKNNISNISEYLSDAG